MSELVQRLALAAQRFTLAAPAVEGQVTQVLGMLIEGTARNAALGDLYRIEARDADVLAEVVALKGSHVLLMPFGSLLGMRIGARLIPAGEAATVGVGEALKGRVIDALGNPLDGKAPPRVSRRRAIYAEPLAPLDRAPIREQLAVGVRAIDAFVPCGRGQRLGIFAGAGVGKTVLLGMMAKRTSADVVVLGLVGERGREVGHFVDTVLGERGLGNCVVVVATSDRPASERTRAAFVATSIAEWFREQGAHVLLFLDSLTRLCMAQREIGLAVGEPPTTKGYPPSAFARLPLLLERAGLAKSGGSVTGMYTVLVEGDDLTDPVADSARALLDGHIVLSRNLAARNHYPAVDVLASLSRVEREVLEQPCREAARVVRTWMARVEEARDLIAVGAYRPGADAQLDEALRHMNNIHAFVQQRDDEPAESLQGTRARLQRVAQGAAC